MKRNNMKHHGVPMFGDRCIFPQLLTKRMKNIQSIFSAYLSRTHTNLDIVVIQWLSRRQRRRTSFGCTLKKEKIILSELHLKFKSSTDNERASL